MGQNARQCHSNSTAKDFMSHQIKIYKWRADPNCNAHLPKVTFQDALSYKQRETYIQFMMLKSKNDAIEIQQLRAQMELIPPLSNQQVVIFQKYVGSLENIKQYLTLQETMYCLTELLFGFEQIKKMYKEIVVNSNCCFVTRNGQIRAWISPNPKCNKIESENILTERQYKEIIQSILDITFQSASKTPILCNFFEMIRTKLKQTVKRNQSFQLVRSIIQQYRIANNLNLKTLKEFSLTIQTQNQLAMRNTTQNPLHIRVDNTEQHIFTHIDHTQFQDTQIKASFMQSKAVQSHNSTEISNITKTSFPNFNYNHSTHINSANLSEYHQMVSYPPYESLLLKFVTEKPSESNGETTVRLSHALQKSEKPIKSINKTNSNYTPVGITLKGPSKLLSSESLKISLSNFSNEAVMQSIQIKNGQIDHPNFSKRQSKYKSENKEEKFPIEKHFDTIMDRERVLVEINRQQYLKPYSDVRCGSIRSVNSSTQAHHRPWMTSKTINKLICESLSGSVVQSVGTSQSQVSQLESGMLTRLAHDSNEKKVSSTSINEF